MPYMRTPLTEEQAADLRDCWMEWIRIRTENGRPEFPSSADIFKGCLLGRMTMQGKPPLPSPPPTSYSAPWYSLIENNGANLHGGQMGFSDVSGPHRWTEEDDWLFICQYRWKILRMEGAAYIITCDNAPGEWTLRHRTKDDPQVRGGRTLQEDGTYGPFYLNESDWILVGPSHGG
jgi:hypothetical protein